MLSLVPQEVKARPVLSLEEALRGGPDAPVSLLVRAVGCSGPRIFHPPRYSLPGEVGVYLRLRTAAGEEVEAVVGGELWERGQDAIHSGERLVAVGRLRRAEAHGPRRGGQGPAYALDLAALEELPDRAALLGAPAEELAEADDTLARFATKPERLREHLLEEARALLGLEDPGSHRLQELDTLCLLQALSHGPADQDENPRLTVFCLSRYVPRRRRLARLAALLAPRFSIGTLDPVGLKRLLPRVLVKDSGNLAEPGLIGDAAPGTLVLEGLHELKDKALVNARGHLFCLVEKGLMCPRDSPCATYQADAAVLVLAERAGHLGRLIDRGLWSSHPAVIFFELLTCFDVVVDADAGVDWIAPSESGHGRPDPARARRLKLLLARICDRLPDVDIDPYREEVGGVIDRFQDAEQALLRGLADRPRALFQTYHAQILHNLALTTRKLVRAAARMEARPTINRNDIEWVFRLGTRKLETLAALCSPERDKEAPPDPPPGDRLLH